MAKVKTVYICSNCGAQSSKWVGKCPSCNEWNTYQEEIINSPTPGRIRNAGLMSPADQGLKDKPKSLDQITANHIHRIVSGNKEFDRVTGGGLVPGSLVLVGGQPGIGKSTLILQLAISIRETVLYVSGEESEEQIKLRAERLGSPFNNCYVYSETNILRILQQAEELQPSLIVIDSIQTVYIDWLESSAGSITQIRESAAELQRFAKSRNITIIVIGHITKDGDLAGPKLLEHIVDTVLYFEGDNHYAYRLLRSRKNRFGSTDEIGVFEMTSSGLSEVENPSEILSSKRDESYSGNAIGTIGEGSRTFLIEVQALVARAVYGTPQRSATGYDNRRMNMLLAVLEKKCQLPLGFNDVFLNIAGGLRVDDPSIDLALAVAVVSSLENKPVDPKFCFIGEIGLSGEIRPVQKIDQKLLEAERLGIKTAFISKYSKLAFNSKKLAVIKLTSVEELLDIFN